MIPQCYEDIVGNNILEQIYRLTFFYGVYFMSDDEIVLVFFLPDNRFRYGILDIFSEVKRFQLSIDSSFPAQKIGFVQKGLHLYDAFFEGYDD